MIDDDRDGVALAATDRFCFSGTFSVTLHIIHRERRSNDVPIGERIDSVSNAAGSAHEESRLVSCESSCERPAPTSDRECSRPSRHASVGAGVLAHEPRTQTEVQ